MEILVATCATVWGLVAVYIGWLGVQQRRLTTRLENLEHVRSTATTASPSCKKAA